MSAIHKLLEGSTTNPYGIGEDVSSDEENSGESSEDELRDLLAEGRTADLEQEMQVEGAVANTNSESTNPEGTNGVAQEENAPTPAGCYSEDYFSSGSDDDANQVGGVASKSQMRRKITSDEDMFYDPNMDAEDESWVEEQRFSHRKGKLEASQKIGQDVLEPNTDRKQEQKGSTKKRKAPMQKAPQSDAILSCPACLTTLCIDCQRHDIYRNQFRAMFVMNCHVIQDEVLRYDEPKHRHLSRKGKKQKTSNTGNGGPSEAYHPVKCSECSTEVAVYDEDEVYHFFNILTSHA